MPIFESALDLTKSRAEVQTSLLIKMLIMLAVYVKRDYGVRICVTVYR